MPIYPKVMVNDRIYLKTKSKGTFIEYLKYNPRNPNDKEIVYISFFSKKRWRVKGNCYSCGILEAMRYEKDGTPVLPEGIVLMPGKKLGERYSVKDLNYDTRLDNPCGPTYERDARQEAESLGVEYQCGLKCEELPWEE